MRFHLYYMDCISKRHAVATIQPKAVNRAWIQTTQKNMRRLYHTMGAKAKRLGATELRPSWRKGKKWAVLYRDRWYHFGAKGMSDFSQHRDPARRASYRRRHAGIYLKDGRAAYTVKTSPAYWSWHLLW